MTKIESLYRRAGQLFYLSSALHIVAIALSGGALFSQLIVAVFLWALIGYGLINRPRRWLAYIGFLGALFGIVAATYGAMDADGQTLWAMIGIVLADIGVAVTLFGALWRTQIKA